MTKFKVQVDGIYVRLKFTIIAKEVIMELFDKIRILRKARGLTQEGLGYKLSKTSKDGVSRQSVSDWENGKSEPKLDNIRDLAKVLDVSFDALLDENINLNDEETLNAVLKHLDNNTKSRINSAFRYDFYTRILLRKDYIKLVVFLIFLVIGLSFLITGICIKDHFEFYFYILLVGIIFLSSFIVTLPLTIQLIKIIKKGGREYYLGSITQSHFIVDTSSSNNYEQKLYIPIEQIEKMEVEKSTHKNHQILSVFVKDKNKALVTLDIFEANKVMDIFNNLNSSKTPELVKEGKNI